MLFLPRCLPCSRSTWMVRARESIKAIYKCPVHPIFLSQFYIFVSDKNHTLTHSTAHAHAHAHAHVRTHTHARAHARTLVTFQLSKPTTRCGYVFIFFSSFFSIRCKDRRIAQRSVDTRGFGGCLLVSSCFAHQGVHEILVEQLFLFS